MVAKAEAELPMEGTRTRVFSFCFSPFSPLLCSLLLQQTSYSPTASGCYKLLFIKLSNQREKEALYGQVSQERTLPQCVWVRGKVRGSVGRQAGQTKIITTINCYQPVKGTQKQTRAQCDYKGHLLKMSF